MKNIGGAVSKTVTDVYSKTNSMTEMKSHFMSKPTTTFDDITEEVDMTYDLTENADVSVAQSKECNMNIVDMRRKHLFFKRLSADILTKLY
jgi:hypothetical protein